MKSCHFWPAFALALAACGGNEAGENGAESAAAGGEMTAGEVADELSGIKIQPGQWEATHEIVSASAPGLPPEVLQQMRAQKTNISSCITPEQAANPDANFLAAQKDSNCTYQDWSMRGGRIGGTMTCQEEGQEGKVVMKMDGTYGDTSYDMTMDMTTLAGSETAMQIKARALGKRVGECTAESRAEAEKEG